MQTKSNDSDNRIIIFMVFWGGVLIYLLAVLPFLISHKGLFFYYGDYNVQQVPFLIFAHRAVRQGRFFWNPLVDLGGNMTGTFAFYLWGSPFFWLTIPFPENWLVHIMPAIMALKYGTASASSYAWLRTQTRTARAAVLGSMLYAFSGFQACNIVFQHFHDVTAFFPLYLLAFDRFVQGRRESDRAGFGHAVYASRIARNRGAKRGAPKGLLGFILMTALMSVINYYFFFGQVVFFVLYYFVRWGIRLARAEGPATVAFEILRILAAGLTGLMLSAFFLVQSIGGIIGNTRISKVLDGYDLIIYPDSSTPMAILKTFFMVPDLIARGTLFTNDNIRNGSLGFYLPCFAMAGVFAFWMLRRHSWKKTLLAVFAVMAFVPVLCSVFSAFNSNFYVRWFYMPVLLCACMTAEAMEEEDSRIFTRGVMINTALTAMFILFCFLPVQKNGKWLWDQVGNNRGLLMTEIRATLLGAALLLVIVCLKRRSGNIFCRSGILSTGNVCILLTIICCIISTAAVVDNGSSLISYTGFEKWKRQMLTERPLLYEVPESLTESQSESQTEDQPEIQSKSQTEARAESQSESPSGSLPQGPVPGLDAPFSRVETDSTSTNYEMVWGYPTMHCFESTVHPSIFTWYRGIGMIRTVESTLPLERIGARALMSVRYYIENTLVTPDKSYTDQGGMEGYSLLNGEKGYQVYETENYIPMGFCFDRYMSEENYDKIENGTISDRVLVKDIILSDEMIRKYGSYLTEDTDTAPGEMPYWMFRSYCADRAASACTDFAFDRNGYHATARMASDNLLLFSVPYDRGFTATVDGKPAEVERADFGLSAVFVPAGEHEIRVTYLPFGFRQALIVSLATAAGLVMYLIYRRLQLQHR